MFRSGNPQTNYLAAGSGLGLNSDSFAHILIHSG